MVAVILACSIRESSQQSGSKTHTGWARDISQVEAIFFRSSMTRCNIASRGPLSKFMLVIVEKARQHMSYLLYRWAILFFSFQSGEREPPRGIDHQILNTSHIRGFSANSLLGTASALCPLFTLVAKHVILLGVIISFTEPHCHAENIVFIVYSGRIIFYN